MERKAIASYPVKCEGPKDLNLGKVHQASITVFDSGEREVGCDSMNYCEQLRRCIHLNPTKGTSNS